MNNPNNMFGAMSGADGTMPAPGGSGAGATGAAGAGTGAGSGAGAGAAGAGAAGANPFGGMDMNAMLQGMDLNQLMG